MDFFLLSVFSYGLSTLNENFNIFIVFISFAQTSKNEIPKKKNLLQTTFFSIHRQKRRKNALE